MAVFGGQYYLELRTLACQAASKAGDKLTRPALFDWMWAEHCKKPAIATLDEGRRKAEQRKIRDVIEGLGFKLPYSKPPKSSIAFQTLYRNIEAASDSDYLTAPFTERLTKLHLMLSLGHRSGLSKRDLSAGRAIFERLQKRGYIWKTMPTPHLAKAGAKSYEVDGDGLPKHFITSHFESARRKH